VRRDPRQQALTIDDFLPFFGDADTALKAFEFFDENKDGAWLGGGWLDGASHPKAQPLPNPWRALVLKSAPAPFTPHAPPSPPPQAPSARRR
jgi:hypothetical protein